MRWLRLVLWLRVRNFAFFANMRVGLVNLDASALQKWKNGATTPIRSARHLKNPWHALLGPRHEIFIELAREGLRRVPTWDRYSWALTSWTASRNSRLHTERSVWFWFDRKYLSCFVRPNDHVEKKERMLHSIERLCFKKRTYASFVRTAMTKIENKERMNRMRWRKALGRGGGENQITYGFSFCWIYIHYSQHSLRNQNQTEKIGISLGTSWAGLHLGRTMLSRRELWTGPQREVLIPEGFWSQKFSFRTQPPIEIDLPCDCLWKQKADQTAIGQFRFFTPYTVIGP